MFFTLPINGKSAIVLTSAIAIAFAVGFSARSFKDAYLFAGPGEDVSVEKEPLYWVAPMDPNYRRDKPGKSPMGMDLVPVYEESTDADDLAGTVAVSSAVQNTLGVRSEEVSTTRLTPEIRTVGRVGYDEESFLQINSRVEGWVENLWVSSNGEFVAAGTKLFDLYSPELVDAQQALLSALRSGQRTLVDASKKRLESLDVPTEVIERITRNGQVEQTLTFHAPKDGYVAQLNTRQGGYINPSNTVVELASLESVWVVADVFERQSQQVRPGQKAHMRVEYLPGQTWQGVVDYIYPELDPQTRSLRVRLRFDNPGKTLRPNMYSKVSIETGAFETLNIPASALIQSGQKTRVVKDLGGGKFRSARVEMGRTVGDRVEILAGLTEGDRVVTSAQFLLDSESSISADLTRFEEPVSDRVWMTGVVEDIVEGNLYITHDPVPEWEWPTMSMFFEAGEEVDSSAVVLNVPIRFEVEKVEGGGYRIIAIENDNKGNEP